MQPITHHYPVAPLDVLHGRTDLLDDPKNSCPKVLSDAGIPRCFERLWVEEQRDNDCATATAASELVGENVEIADLRW